MAPAIMIMPKFEAGSTVVPALVLHHSPAQDLANTLSVRSFGAGQRSGIGVGTRTDSGGGFHAAHDAPALERALKIRFSPAGSFLSSLSMTFLESVNLRRRRMRTARRMVNGGEVTGCCQVARCRRNVGVARKFNDRSGRLAERRWFYPCTTGFSREGVGCRANRSQTY